MSSPWVPPPPPPTRLGRYRTLSPRAGVRVSPLQLGAMSIGDKWHNLGMRSMDKLSSFKLLDAYFDAGVSGRQSLRTLSGLDRPFRETSSIRQTISKLFLTLCS